MKKIIKHPLVLTIFSGLIITPIGSAIYDTTKSIPILTNYILMPLNVFWKLILSAIFFKVSIGLIMLILTILIVTSFLLLKKHFANLEKEERQARINAQAKKLSVVDAKPATIEKEFLNYKQDVIKGWKWSWEYVSRGNGKYHVDNLKAHCLDDDTIMYNVSANFVCPRCDKNWLRPYMGENSVYYQHRNIKILIADNVKKGL